MRTASVGHLVSRQYAPPRLRVGHIAYRSKCTVSASTIRVENPYTEETYCEVEKMGQEQMERVLATAHKMQHEYWIDTAQNIGLVERQQICLNFLDEFEKHSEEIAKDISCMMGKPLQQSRNEIATTRERGEAMIDMSTQFLSDQPVPPKLGFDRKIRKEPLGTILVIVPWNYPLVCTINSLMPAMLSGNSVILKLSSKTPLLADYFIRAFEACGVPRGVIQAVHCDHELTTQMIRDERISGVVFTGSVSGGYAIQNATANRLINATLELGGKDAAYVARDADLEAAVESIVDGAMYNAGQSCCGLERVYVHKDRYEKFVTMARDIASGFYVMGDPLYEHPRDIDARRKAEAAGLEQGAVEDDEQKQYDASLQRTTTMGPMAQRSSVAFLERQVQDALDKGAQLVMGDGQGCTDAQGKGRFFTPTILKDCNHSMSVMKDESFGPILPIQSVDSDQDAIDLMNDSIYGLTAAVYTKDKVKMERVFAPKIQTGTVFQNRCDYLDPYLPWTGVKQTGKGVSLSHYGFNNFTKLKSLNFKKY